MNTDPNNPQTITSTPAASLSRRTFIKKAAGTALVFGIGMTIAQATTFDPPISQPGRVTSCTNPSPSGSPKTMSCWQREVSDLWPNNAYDVAALTAARDAAQTAFRNATDRNIDDPSLINLALVAAAKNALDAAQAALDAAGVAQECNNAQGMGQVGGGAPCTIIANPTCVAWAVANGKQGNGQCVW